MGNWNKPTWPATHFDECPPKSTGLFELWKSWTDSCDRYEDAHKKYYDASSRSVELGKLCKWDEKNREYSSFIKESERLRELSDKANSAERSARGQYADAYWEYWIGQSAR